MLKQISISQLKTGMFLHDLDLNLSLFPAIKKQSNITNRNQLQNIVDTGIQEVTIDTVKGNDIEESGLTSLKHKITITHGKNNRQVIPAPSLPKLEPSSLEEEIQIAKSIRKHSMEVMENAFSDIKMGRKINTHEVKSSVKKMTDSIIRNQDALLALGQIRLKSSYLFDHAINTCVLSLAFAKWKKIDYETVINLGTAALLHDIGETKLDDKLLNLKGRLNDQQFVETQKHVEYSVQLLSTNPGIHPLVVKIVQQHHERLDGSGYPNGFKDKEIDPLAQILGLVDIYDSMTAETLYSYATAPTQVLKQLLESDNELFDSLLIKQFIKCIGIYPIGSLVKLSNGCIAIVNEILNHDSLHPNVKVIYNARQEHFIQPIDLKLSELINSNESISIKGCVDPNHLHINLAAFI